MKIFFFLLSLLLSAGAIAQKPVKVKGIIKTSEGKALSGASVVLSYAGSKDSLKAVSSEKGSFSFSNVNPGKVTISITYIGYKKFVNEYDYTGATGEQNIWDIMMSPGDYTLETVTVEAAKIQIKEDTVSYKIDSTMYRKNDNVEQVLKNLPGVQVDKDGKVTAQGKEVTKVKVNGKEFFGGDVTTATRELNADMVDKIQIVDDYGDQSAFTGVRDGEAGKTLNIQLKKEKNKGYFGTVTAGGGTEGRYLGSLSLNLFNNDRQVSIIGNINNTNASTFNFGAMSGMANSLGIGRGGAGVGSSFGNFGNNDGINLSKSLGINFKDQWGPGVSAYGSYSLTQKDTRTLNNVTQQNIFLNSSTTNIQNSNSFSQNTNHRFSFNIEYKIDSFNYIKFTPAVSYRSTNANSASDFSFLRNNKTKANDGVSSTVSQSDVPNFSGTVLYNHRFAKRGRTLSLNINAGSSRTKAEDYSDNSTTYFDSLLNARDSVLNQYITQDNNNNNAGVRASYIEPLSRKKSLEFNYSHNWQKTGNDRENFIVDPVTGAKVFADTLSNIFDNTYITNRVGVNFRTNEKKYNYSIGLAVQPASIQTNSLTGKYLFKQNIVNYFPAIRYAYNFSRSRSFSINYDGRTNQPTYTQLQPVTDYSNPQYLVTGNPNLRPEFTNSLNMRYNNFDFISGNVFFGNLSASFTNDKIVNNTIRKTGGGQETRYLNADGYFTLSGFYNVSKPVQNRKYVFNYGGNLTYNNNISFVSDEKNKGKNWVIGQRFSTDYKLKKWLETNLALNFRLNTTEYSLLKQQNSTTRAWTISHNSRIFLPKNFIFNYDLDKTINSGYTDNITANPFIINTSLEKQFFEKKNFSLKLQALDILNENISVSRTVTGSAITDTRTNRLGRYFMLTAILRLNKFQGKAPEQNRMMMGPPGGGPGINIIRN
jgi:Outer membrane protein beta-barrel family/Carboxypeptidase regulatory-like domain